MPTYQYECPNSKCAYTEREIIKPLSALDDEERCTLCNEVMVRLISAVQISPSAKPFEAHHNHAFGKTITSKHQIREEQARYKGEKGRELVEVGTDDLSSVKKVRKQYKVEL